MRTVSFSAVEKRRNPQKQKRDYPIDQQDFKTNLIAVEQLLTEGKQKLGKKG